MAKESMKAREAKREKLNLKFKKKREDIKAKLKQAYINEDVEEALNLQFKLQSLKRDSSPSRMHNRCKLTGRPKGYMRTFGVSRVMFREMANKGLIPGVTKASW